MGGLEKYLFKNEKTKNINIYWEGEVICWVLRIIACYLTCCVFVLGE